ncbi:hypothetical protein JCM9279_004120 [Rhodotorula babjevae]
MVERRARDVRLDLGAFDHYDSRPASPTSPDNVDMRSPLLSGWNRSPPPSPSLSPSSRAAHRPRRFAFRPRRIAALLALALTATILLVQSREHAVLRQARGHAARLAQRLGEQRCKYVPGLAPCADPFRQVRFEACAGELLYPAAAASPASSSSSIEAQPHPIHYLIREAEASWQDKVARQSRTLAEAVAEYKRRYRQPPPRGFDAWFAFAQENGVQLLDEYDSIHSRLRPFAAIRPEVLRERDAILQNVSQWDVGETFWMHPLTVTIKVGNEGRRVEAEGPMRHANNRADQLMSLLEGISQFLPDLNMTITGHDVPWVVMAGEHKEMLIDAADKGEYLDDAATFKENWDLDGWALSCPPSSPIRAAGTFLDRLDWKRPAKTSFIGLDHVKAMDVCSHPENQALHGFTSWTGPRPGVIFPLFSFTTSSLTSDILLPPLEQYERSPGPDPSWSDKKHDKALWRGSTTGGDLTNAHARKYSQRMRLARLPGATKFVTVPLALDDREGAPGPVVEHTAPASEFADAYLDVLFSGGPAQCGDEATCAEIEREFEWAGYMSEAEQNEYKYILDVDGNGWSGRFHRLMSTNSLILKSTVFPEWYSDRIQPWVHYVPVKTDYTDLYPILAFFKGAPEDGQGGHDALAERIAAQGKQWAEENWRWVDMQAYLLRLLLEYARLVNRDDPHVSYDFDLE